MNRQSDQGHEQFKDARKIGGYMDRRSGEDRRRVYSLVYFQNGGVDRRDYIERRFRKERRKGCFRVSEWSSVCPDYTEEEWVEGRIRIKFS